MGQYILGLSGKMNKRKERKKSVGEKKKKKKKWEMKKQGNVCAGRPKNIWGGGGEHIAAFAKDRYRLYIYIYIYCGHGHVTPLGMVFYENKSLILGVFFYKKKLRSRHLFYYFLRENKTRNKILFFFFLIDSMDKENGLRPLRTSLGVKLRREKV